MERRERNGVFAGVLVAVLIAAGAVWWGLSSTVGKANWQDVAYNVIDARTVTVRFQVTKPPSSTARCTVQAQEVGHAVVGRTTVVIPPSTERIVNAEATVRTATLAVIGQVRTCVLD